MVNWGILGAGNIAHRFAASLQHHPDGDLVAISGRNAEKLAIFATQFGVGQVYLDHAALLTDPSINAIYLSLPHGLHREWALKALYAGKAVLCEKPATLNANEMREIAKTARLTHTLFMEAMKPRFVPLYAQLQILLEKGIIGTVTRVETSLCNNMPFEIMGNSYHTQLGQGGCLLDCGCYCASWLEALLPGAPHVEHVECLIKNELDYYINAELRFGNKTARLECAFDRAKPRQAVIYGTNGHIILDELHRPQKMILSLLGQISQTFTVPYYVDDFYGQIDHFMQCLQNNKIESDIMPFMSSIRCAEILDKIKATGCTSFY